MFVATGLTNIVVNLNDKINVRKIFDKSHAKKTRRNRLYDWRMRMCKQIFDKVSKSRRKD